MCFALFAWFPRAELLAGIVKTATGKECKTFGRLRLDISFARLVDLQRLKNVKVDPMSVKVGHPWSKCSDTNVVFQAHVFLVPVIRTHQRASKINSKTSDCISRISLYSVLPLPSVTFLLVTVLWIVWACDVFSLIFS